MSDKRVKKGVERTFSRKRFNDMADFPDFGVRGEMDTQLKKRRVKKGGKGVKEAVQKKTPSILRANQERVGKLPEGRGGTARPLLQRERVF